ncbi:hypothetical protein AAC387_Pa03g1542 [Persea americana]
MDKSWMLLYQNRFSQPYIDGVNSFIEFAKANSGGSRVIKCPCNYCCNSFKHDYEIVRDHLLVRGMMVSYDTWLQHGELAQSDEPDDSEDESGEDDDNEEYLPPQGDLGSVSSNKDIGDDGDDESSSSQANMVTRTNQGKRSRHACVVAAALAQATRSSRAKSMPEWVAQATSVQPLVTRSSCADNMPEVATNARPTEPTQVASSSGQPNQVLSPRTVGNSVTSASGKGSSRVRGKTRGMKVTKLRRQLGHAIPISIPASSHAPEGEFVTTFANLLGEAIRDEAPVRKEGWKFVPEGIKKLVVKRVQQTFEFGDYVNDPIIKVAVDAKCQKLYKDWKCDLHTHYLSLLEAGVPDPKSHPLKPCKADEWAWMIGNLWETVEWKEKSRKARESRLKMSWNHTSGSRSFLARNSMIISAGSGFFSI